MTKLSIKIDEEARQPLLLGSADNENDEEFKKHDSDIMSMLTSPRVNTRKMSAMGGADPMKRRTTNAHKTLNDKQDKFESGKKTELLKAQREADEMQKRKLDQQREKDAQDLKTQLGNGSVKNVIMPTYGTDERLKVDIEVNPPP